MSIKYKTLTDKLLKLIQTNITVGIDKLPSESELCRKYNVSRQTVRAALSILEEDGIIIKKVGAGSYITGLSNNPSKNVIAFVVSNESEYTAPTFIHEVTRNLSEVGFTTKIYSTHNDINRESEILDDILQNNYRAVIVEPISSSLPNPNIDKYNILTSRFIPVLFIKSKYSELTNYPCIKGNNDDAIRQLLEHLSQNGHYKIGTILMLDDNNGIERYKAYIDYQRNTFQANELFSEWFTSKDLYNLEQKKDNDFIKKAAQELLISCTAIICHNDEIAYWLIRELKLSGNENLDQIAIVSFDNSYLSESSVVPITSLGINHHEFSKQVSASIINMIKGMPVTTKELFYTLTIRQSSKKQLQSK